MDTLQERSKTTHLVVHCSGTPFGSVAGFRKYHMEFKGLKDIGFNLMIGNGLGMPDGSIEPGRDEWVAGAHCIDYNQISIGICLIGDIDRTPPTQPQTDTLIRTLTDLCIKYHIPAKNILGHRETLSGQAQGKTCPGKLLDMNQIRSLVQKQLQNNLQVVNSSLAV